jgi:hypothetical protein
MARYDHLTVYHDMYRFIKEFYRVKAKLPRYIKNDLGQMVSLSSLRCVKGIVVANGSLLKTKTLSEIIIEIEAIWTLLRLLYDLKGISRGEFDLLSRMLEKVSPQIQNWLKWEKRKIKAEKENPII